MSKLCPVCRRKFDPVGRQKYHDLICKQRAYRSRQKSTLKLKPCANANCRIQFPVTKSNRLYHSVKCAKAADNSRQRLRMLAKAAAKEILRQRKAEASNQIDLAIAVEQISTAPGRLPKVTVRLKDDAAAALAQALEDQAGAERAAIVRNEKPGFDPVKDAFDIRQFHIDQQKHEQQSPQGQGPSIEVLQRIKAAEENK